jgi:hypothetical protein
MCCLFLPWRWPNIGHSARDVPDADGPPKRRFLARRDPGRGWATSLASERWQCTLMEYQLLPYERASELLKDLFGEPAPRAGTLYSAVERCFEGLEQTEDWMQKRV